MTHGVFPTGGQASFGQAQISGYAPGYGLSAVIITSGYSRPMYVKSPCDVGVVEEAECWLSESDKPLKSQCSAEAITATGMTTSSPHPTPL